MPINEIASPAVQYDEYNLEYAANDQSRLVPSSELRTSTSARFLRTLRKISIEPVLFFSMIGIRLPEIPTENLLIYKVCIQDHFNTTVCDNILNKVFFTFKETVQSDVSDWKIYIGLILAVPTVFLTIVVGPWSDKYGRKGPLIIPILGRIVSNSCLLVNVYYLDSPVIYLILSFLPTAFTGSNLFHIISCSYISDITTKKNRTIRLAVMQFLMYLGEPVAVLAGGNIYRHFGFYPLIVVAIACLSLAFLFGLFVVKETVNSDATKMEKFKDFFSIGILKEGFKTLLKKRSGKKRLYIWLYLIANMIFILYRVVDWNISYMFTQLLLQWNINEFTLFTAVRQIVGLISLIVLAPVLSRVYRVKDHTFVIFGMISAIVCYLIFGLCHSSRLLYLGGVIGGFMGLAALGIMSALSKIVDDHEQGKLFTLLLTADVIIPIIGTTIQMQIYKNTLKSFPGVVYLANSAFLIVPLVIVLWMKKDDQRKLVEIACQTDERTAIA